MLPVTDFIREQFKVANFTVHSVAQKTITEYPDRFKSFNKAVRFIDQMIIQWLLQMEKPQAVILSVLQTRSSKSWTMDRLKPFLKPVATAAPRQKPTSTSRAVWPFIKDQIATKTSLKAVREAAEKKFPDFKNSGRGCRIPYFIDHLAVEHLLVAGKTDAEILTFMTANSERVSAWTSKSIAEKRRSLKKPKKAAALPVVSTSVVSHKKKTLKV
jgi:hypothetical protein